MKKKKLLLISTLIATQLVCKNILSLKTMEKNPQRVTPNSSNQILSFNNSIKRLLVNSIVNISAKRQC